MRQLPRLFFVEFYVQQHPLLDGMVVEQLDDAQCAAYYAKLVCAAMVRFFQDGILVIWGTTGTLQTEDGDYIGLTHMTARFQRLPDAEAKYHRELALDRTQYEEEVLEPLARPWRSGS